MLRILPQEFFANPDVNTLLADGHSCIFYKRFQQPAMGREGFISTHAITFVRRGMLRVEFSDGQLLEVPQGKMVLFPKGIYTVSDILPTVGDYEAVMFFFEKKVIEGFVQSLEIMPALALAAEPILLEMHEKVADFAENLIKTYQDQVKSSRQLASLKLTELLYLLDEASPTGRFAALVANLNNRERRSLREFMEANFAKPLDIKDYAFLTGRSVSSFRRDFKAQFGGISPKQWLIERRLERAGELLASQKMSISEVVLEIGFDDIPHFIKTFGQKFGVPPKQFSLQKQKKLLV